MPDCFIKRVGIIEARITLDDLFWFRAQDGFAGVVGYLREGAREFGVGQVWLQFVLETRADRDIALFGAFVSLVRSALIAQAEVKAFLLLGDIQTDRELLEFLGSFDVYSNIQISGCLRDGQISRACQEILAAAGRGEIRRPAAQLPIDPRLDPRVIETLTEHGFRSFDLRWPALDHGSALPADVAGTGAALVATFAAWLLADNPNIMIVFFHEALTQLKIGPQSEGAEEAFSLIERVALTRFGARYGLSRYEALEASVPLDEGMAAVLNGVEAISIRTALRNPAPKCSDCCWLGVCGGGAIATRFSHAQGYGNESVFCTALDDLYTTMASTLVKAGLPDGNLARNLERLADVTYGLREGRPAGA